MPVCEVLGNLFRYFVLSTETRVAVQTELRVVRDALKIAKSVLIVELDHKVSRL